jgi:phasin protein
MSKRKTASKHARSPKIAAKAQLAAQAIIKSTKVARRSVSEAAELAPKPHRDAKPAAPLALETSGAAMEENVTHTMTDKSMSKFDLSSVTANVRAYQAKLIEMTQTNLAFSFEFSHRLASVRSPVELFTVIAEFTDKRIALIGKYSKEMIELGAKGTS